MSLESTQPDLPPMRDMREAARAQTRRLTAGLVYVFAVGLAVFLVLVLTVLDYRFHQDAHRLWKVLLGVAFIVAIFMLPRFGIAVFPIATPYLAWLPKVPIPALNPLNIMLFGVFGAWAAPRVAARQPIFRRGHLSTIMTWLFVVGALSIVRGTVFPTGYHYPAASATIDFLRSSLTFLVYFIGLAMVSGEADRRRLAWAVVIGLAAESITTIQYGQTGSGGRAVGSGYGGPPAEAINVHTGAFTFLGPGPDCDPTVSSCTAALWFEALCDEPIVYSLSGADATHGG